MTNFNPDRVSRGIPGGGQFSAMTRREPETRSLEGYGSTTGLRQHTDFADNAIGIDPAGCGCTDCLTGHSIPADDEDNMKLLAEEVHEFGRATVNRTGTTVDFTVGRDGYGCVVGAGNGSTTGLRQETDFRNNAIAIDPPGCGCTDCATGNSIPLDDEDNMKLLAEEVVGQGRATVNRTGLEWVDFSPSRDGGYGFQTSSY